MPIINRTVFFISDRTGITIQTLGSSMLTQFDGIHFHPITLPFVDSLEKARQALTQIEAVREETGERPLIFISIMSEEIRAELTNANGLILDLYERFLIPMELELNTRSAHAMGRSHSVGNANDYNKRIEAINYTLAHDDGMINRSLDQADIILVGVSRSGKTPTCLYMALQLGIKAANYPFIPEDFEAKALPPALVPLKHKVWGLTIKPERLQRIRQERTPGSKYASLSNCNYEVDSAEKLMTRNNIPFLNSTSMSIEELATTIVHKAELTRHLY